MTSFAFLPASADVARARQARPDAAPPDTARVKTADSAEEKVSSSLYWANAVEEATQRYRAAGDTVIKCCFCARHYGAVLLDSGVLLLLAPHAPEQHGRPLMPHADGLASSSQGGDCETVVDVSAGDSHIVFCTVSGAVYTLGYDNEFGQLGDGSVWRAPTSPDHSAACDVPPPLTPPRRLPGFGYVPPAHRNNEGPHPLSEETTASASSRAPAVGGCSQVAPRTAVGETWYAPLSASVETFAENRQGATTKHSAPAGSRGVMITAVSCGAQHTLLLTLRRNAVYACGRGHCGQLSGSRMCPAQPVFRSIPLLFGLPIESIQAAGHHSFVVLQTGRLLAFGENTCGQLGLGHTENVVRPTPVTFLPDVRTAVDCTHEGEHTSPTPTSLRTDVSGEAAQPTTEAFAASNGTVVARRRPSSRPAPASSSTTTRGLATSPPRRGHVREPLLDANTYQALRAPYNSVESVKFPLRVQRLSAALGPGEEAIAAVYACAELTVVRTRSMEWFSCGIPLTLGTDTTGTPQSPHFQCGQPLRADRRGALGRALHSRREAYRFARMRWPRALTEAIEALRASDRVTATHGADEASEDGRAALHEDDPTQNASLGSPSLVAHCRRATNAPTIDSQSGPRTDRAAPLESTTSGEGGAGSGCPWRAPVQCFCYPTLVAVAVRVAQQPTDAFLFTQSSHAARLLDVHRAPPPLAAQAATVEDADPDTPVARYQTTSGVPVTTRAEANACDWQLSVRSPLSTIGSTCGANDGIDEEAPIRLPDTASDASTFHVHVGSSEFVGMPKGVLIM